MRFICDKCKAKYSIADEKINKKVLKIRCKKCSHVIIVRDTKQQAASSMSSLSAASSLKASTLSSSQLQGAQSNPFTPQRPAQQRPAQQRPAPQRPAQQRPAQQPAQARPAPQISSLGPAHDDDSDVGERTVVARISSEWFNQIREEKKEEPIWFVASQGQPVGPIVLSDVNMRIRNRELSRDELVWCAGWADWVPASTVTELQPAFHSLTGTPPPPPPIRVPVPPAAAPQVQAQPVQAQPVQAQPVQAQPVQAQPVQAQPVQAQPAQAQPFQAQPVNGKGLTSLSFDDMDFNTIPANGGHGEQYANERDFATEPGNPFELIKPSPNLGAPKAAGKPAPHNPFGAPSTGTSAPAKDSPLAMLAGPPAPAPKPATPKPAPSGPTPWDAKPQGQALQTTSTPSKHQTPADVLAAAPAPQPVLQELTTGPAPSAPAPLGKDIAHVQQARPAVEMIEVGAEEDFFKNADARNTQGDDLFDVALPPLPNWEQDAHEIDADDIIEIQDAFKPRWGLRLAILLGLFAGIGGFVIAISWFMGGFKDPVRIASANGPDGDPSQSKVPTIPPRKATKVGSALLGNPLAPGKKGVKKGKRSKKRWRSRSRRRPRSRRTIRLAKAPKSRGGSSDTDINKEIYKMYQRKLGAKPGKSSGGKVRGRIQSGDKLSASLEKRIYKEIARNRGQVKYCYEQYLKKAYLSGRLIIKIRIEQTGQVSQVRITSRKLRRLQVSQCIARKMKRWRFASFRGTPYIDTEIPYLLRAQ